MVHAISSEDRYPICNDFLFRHFMTDSKDSVLETLVSARAGSRMDKVGIIRFAVAGSDVIPFSVLTYNENLYHPKNFERSNHITMDGVYLIEEDAVIFHSSYEASRFAEAFQEITVYTANELQAAAEDQLVEKFNNLISVKKYEGYPETEDMREGNLLIDWYLNDRKPLDYVVRSIKHFSHFEKRPIPYLIKHLRGEDFSAEAFEISEPDRVAQRLAFVEDKFAEFDSDANMQRSLEIARVLYNELDSAVNITVVTKNSSEVKVKNRITTHYNDSMILGDYHASVPVSEVDHIVYKRKRYCQS